MAKQLARELINAGVHFGHGVSRWNPKMAPYIFAKRGTIHIIDVKKTLKGVLVAKKLLAEIVASGSDVVFVGTKRQAQKAVEAAAKRSGLSVQAMTPEASLPGAPDTFASLARAYDLVVLKQSDKLDIMSVNRLEERFDASPAAVGHELFLRGRDYLYCIAEK